MLQRVECPRCGRLMSATSLYCSRCRDDMRRKSNYFGASTVFRWFYLLALLVIIICFIVYLYNQSYRY
jgi:predicted nucleic acid-binding Zn ribbon protein